MAKYYYNGVLLPEIPADVLASYPYAWIRDDGTNGKYDLVVAPNIWYYAGSTLNKSVSGTYPYYSIPKASYLEYDAWAYNADSSLNFGLDSARTVLWSAFNVPNGSATSATIYFYATEPVKETEAKPKELAYDVYTNFYPSGGTFYYEISDLTINYVVPVVKHSTYTVTMTEVGNRLRVYYSQIDPATITANTSATSIAEQSSFPVGYTFTYLAQADGWLVIYVSNAGERPKISIVTNGAGGDGLPPYDRKYLLRSNSTLYTVTDGALVPLPDAEVSASLFQDYGVDEPPDGSLLAGLTDPEVLYWHDSTDDLPTLSLTVTGVPPVPQVVVTDAQDMSDSTILGIESVTVAASEAVLWAVSFDDGATWRAHNGSQWVTLEQENSGMTAETFQNLSLEAWAEVVTSTAYRLRFVLMSPDSYVSEVIVNYIN